MTGRARSINRRKFEPAELRAIVERTDAPPAQVLEGYRRLLAARVAQPAFHPDADQQVLKTNEPSLVGFVRHSTDRSQKILVLGNLGPQKQSVDVRTLTGLRRAGPLANWRSWGTGMAHARLSRATGPDEVTLDEITLSLSPEGIAVQSPAGSANITAKPLGGILWQVRDGETTRRVHLHQTDGTVTLARDGTRLSFALSDPMTAAEEADDGGDSIAAPLPGVVKALTVAPGTAVAAGDVLVVMEAMKMEHSLTAPRDGTVAEVTVRVGEQVDDAVLGVALGAGLFRHRQVSEQWTALLALAGLFGSLPRRCGRVCHPARRPRTGPIVACVQAPQQRLPATHQACADLHWIAWSWSCLLHQLFK